MAGKQFDRASYLYSRDPSLDTRYRPRPDRKVNLFPKISENSVAECSGSSQSSADGKVDTASVYLRLRPTTEQVHFYSIERNIFKTRANDVGTHNAPQRDVQEKHFTFSDVFQNSASQKDVYNTCCFNAIENDENLTVLTYGTSGSGKTFTLLGMYSDNPGIIPRAIEHIFTKYSRKVCKEPVIKLDKGNVVIVEDNQYRVESLRRTTLIAKNRTEEYVQQRQSIQLDHAFKEIDSSDALVVIWVSFAEIYNENVYDLLVPSGSSNLGKENQAQTKRKHLRIISNDGNAFIKDLVAIHCRSSSDAYQLLATGLKNISYASTNINANSSRSHCIFILEVIKYRNQYEFDHTTYKFCDLAGSERQKKTESVGNRLKEAQSINSSLMVLGRCLDAVYHNSSIVPIRDSKLTVLLQASLLGKEKITMIVNMLPTPTYYEENLNVLNFASMAKQIVYKAPPEAVKKLRSTRFSWFINHAATSSPKVSRGDTDANDSQVSILLDENDRLKQELEHKNAIIEELTNQMDLREMQIKHELIADHENRMKRSDEMWNKRLDHKILTSKQEIENAKIHYEESLDEMYRANQKAFQHAWEKQCAEIETEHGIKLARQFTQLELNRCSIIEVAHVQNSDQNLATQQEVEEEEIEKADSFSAAIEESIEISDESGSETSEDESDSNDILDEQPPEKRNRSSN